MQKISDYGLSSVGVRIDLGTKLRRRVLAAGDSADPDGTGRTGSTNTGITKISQEATFSHTDKGLE